MNRVLSELAGDPDKRDRAMIATWALVILVAAGALSYWTAAGSGTASTTLPNPQAITLSAGSPTDPVSPGESAEVAAVATNPNDYEVEISSISLDAGRGSDGFDVDGGHSGCDLSALDFTTQDNGGTGWTVPPRVGSADGSLSIEMGSALTMSAGAANACQGADFTVYLTVHF